VLPDWLALGLGIAAALSVVFAAVFAAGQRLFPSTSRRETSERSGEWKRRREIREYLSAVGERYVEDHEVAGRRVAFYLPERDVAVTFDAEAYFRIEGSPTTAVLMEHETPGAGVGRRLPFETPEVSFDDDAADAVTLAFAALGLDPSASLAEVKAAYRERVKEVHPDHGGDEAEFRRLREAYAAAKQHAEKR
jgi:hypothetical protein